MDITLQILLPIGLGLIGFVEPCSLGGTLLLLKYLKGQAWRTRLINLLMFTNTRAVLICSSRGAVACICWPAVC